MNYYTDIHTHIMPGVDDGSPDLECSIRMLQIAQREHIRKVILTPHQKPDRRCVSTEGIYKRIQLLQDTIKENQLDIEIYPGSELMYHSGLAERLEAGKVCTMAESRYVLIEFLPNEDMRYIRDSLYDICASGYWPIVAHAERCQQLVKNPDHVDELIQMGCYIQMNAGSLTGDWGFGCKRASRKLVKEGLVHFLGTDAHSDSGKRIPKMESCAAWLRKKAGDRYAQELLYQNAEAIFAKQEI